MLLAQARMKRGCSSLDAPRSAPSASDALRHRVAGRGTAHQRTAETPPARAGAGGKGGAAARPDRSGDECGAAAGAAAGGEFAGGLGTPLTTSGLKSARA